MNEAEFRQWRAPRRQAEMFPKAVAWRREHRADEQMFTCDGCGQRRKVRDADPFLFRTCVACAQTLF